MLKIRIQISARSSSRPCEALVNYDFPSSSLLFQCSTPAEPRDFLSKEKVTGFTGLAFIAPKGVPLAWYVSTSVPAKYAPVLSFNCFWKLTLQFNVFQILICSPVANQGHQLEAAQSSHSRTRLLRLLLEHFQVKDTHLDRDRAWIGPSLSLRLL